MRPWMRAVLEVAIMAATIRLCHALQNSCILSVVNESGRRASHE
jgi:hypothetical protein